MQHLHAAERLEPFLDVALAIRKARQLASGGEGKHMNVIARVAFDKSLVVARKCIVSALTSQAEFWAALSEPVPDVAQLMQTSVAMNRAIASAESAFESLLRIRASVSEAARAEWCRRGVGWSASVEWILTRCTMGSDFQRIGASSEVGLLVLHRLRTACRDSQLLVPRSIPRFNLAVGPHAAPVRRLPAPRAAQRGARDGARH